MEPDRLAKSGGSNCQCEQGKVLLARNFSFTERGKVFIVRSYTLAGAGGQSPLASFVFLFNRYFGEQNI